MKSESITDQPPGGAQLAQAEWASLLARLQGPAPMDVRIERVRLTITRGLFHVNARAIADRLIARLLTA
jgi:hypothetical protein